MNQLGGHTYFAIYFLVSYLARMKVSNAESICGLLKLSGRLASYTALARLLPICCKDCTNKNSLEARYKVRHAYSSTYCHLFWSPSIQIDRFHPRNVHPQVAVNTSTTNA